MVRRRIRKKVESLEARIKEHHKKIEQEEQKPQPDAGLIAHWEREIQAFRDAILKARKKLEGTS